MERWLGDFTSHFFGTRWGGRVPPGLTREEVDLIIAPFATEGESPKSVNQRLEKLAKRLGVGVGTLLDSTRR